MPCVTVPGVPVERLDAVEAGETVVVESELTLAYPRVLVEPVELDERDRREHVREIGLDARRRLVVAGAVPTASQPHRPNPLGHVVAVGADETALAGGDVLRGVQRKTRRVGDDADLPAPVHALERM